jgi:malyl-CoA/(S)-citramalyl-CoA lyase
MSFSAINPAPARLNRSQLFVLANKPATFEAAQRSAADVIMFEIEDGVPPSEKAAARQNLIDALNTKNWGRKSLSVRINGLDTPHMYRDLVDLLEAPTERLDLIMIPKAGNRSDIYAVDMIVTQIETAMQRTKRIGFQIMIETAQGLANID